ncbi:tetratricopeptide repeat protein, partial [Anaerolineae bacterium CFX7]|nr:tetratricopeptide repeat protein [Anaerolineae bacterium CFX7]
ALATAHADTLRAEHNWDGSAQAYRTALELAQEFNDRDATRARQNDLIALAQEQTNALFAANKLADAQSAATKYLDTAQEFGDARAQADAYAQRGAIAAAERHWQDARDNYHSSIALLTEPEDAGRVAELGAETERVTRTFKTEQRDHARAQGDAARRAQAWQAAETAYQTSLQLSQELDDTAIQGEIEIARAQTAAAQNDWTRAASLYGAAIAAFDISKMDDRRAELTRQRMAAWQAAGDAAAQTKELATAREHYAQALQDARQLDDQGAIVSILRQRGDAAVEQSDWRSALEDYAAALQAVNAETENQRNAILTAQAQSWQRLGDAEMDAQQLDHAQTAFENAAARFAELNRPADHAHALLCLGQVHAARGDLQNALRTRQIAFDLVRDTAAPAQRAEILETLADTHLQLGNLETARGEYVNALAASAAQPRRQAQLHTQLGEISLTQAHWQDAIAHFNAATARYQILGETELARAGQAQSATAFMELGDVYYGEGNWQDAEAAYENALKLDRVTGRADRDASLWYRLARADAAQAQYAQAIEHYETALAAVDAPEIPLRDRIIGQLAFTLQQQGKQRLAENDWLNAQTDLERALKMAIASDNFDQAADVALALGHALTAQEKFDAAQAVYRQALNLDERDGNALRVHETHQALANCLLQDARTALENGETEIAAQRLAEALPLAERANNPLLLGQTLETLGDATAPTRAEDALVSYAQAARQYAALEAMDLWRGVSKRQANLLGTLAARQSANENYADAANSYRRALTLYQASDESAALGETYLGLGRALSAQAQWALAADAFDRAQEHWDAARGARSELLTLHALALERLGDDAAAGQQWADARAAYQRAAEMQDARNARDAAGSVWHKLAQIAVAQESWDDAADANVQALARLEGADARSATLAQQAEILAHIGQAQQRAGELGLASETYRRALAIAHEQGNLATLANLYAQLGALAEAQTDWETAETEYHHALDVYQETEQPLEQAHTWARLGDMHRAAEQPERASEAYQAARALYRAHKLPLAEGAMLHRLGWVRADVQDWDGALNWYDAALTLFNTHNMRAAKIEIYQSMETAVQRAKRRAAQLAALAGDESLDAGDLAGAEEAYRQAIALYAQADERVLLAQMQNQLGVTLEAQERFDDALEQYQFARAGFQEQEIPAAQVSALANIGDVYRQRSEWRQAQAAYRDALALNETLDDPQRAGELHTLLGQTLEAENDWNGARDHYQSAVTLLAATNQDTTLAQEKLANAERGVRIQTQNNYEQALAQARETNNLPEQGELLNTLGLGAAEDQEWDKALDYFNQAVQTFEQLERTAGNEDVWRAAQGTTLYNIGDTAQATGAWDQADHAYTRALNFAREFNDAPGEALVLAKLGNAALHLGEYPRALDFNIQAYNKYAALGDAPTQAELLERIGNLQLQLEQPAAAEQTFQHCLTLAQAASDSERAARVLMQLGHLATERNAGTDALKYYTDAQRLAEELGQTPAQKVLQYRLGNLYVRRGEWENAAGAFQAAEALALEPEDRSLRATLADKLGMVAAERGEWDSALEHYQTALALIDENDAARAALYQRIGQAQIARGETHAAETAYLTALQIIENDAGETETFALWLKLAALAKQQAHWNDAANYFARARAALAPDALPATQIELALAQGDAALQIPDRDAAETNYEEAFTLAQAHDDRARLGAVYERLGALAQTRREWDEALANFQQAIEIQREIQEPLGEARILNEIARLKLEMQNASEADLFAQAALAIAQAFGSAVETARSLYTRALVALEAQELELAERFLRQASAADPNHAFARLQLGNTLLAQGRATLAEFQAQPAEQANAEWELGAQMQATMLALNADDTRAFRASLKQTRARLRADTERRRVSNDFARAMELLVETLEGGAETTLGELERIRNAPGLPTTLDALQFARSGLLALSKSARRFKGKPALVAYFTPPKPRTRKAARQAAANAEPNARPAPDE